MVLVRKNDRRLQFSTDHGQLNNVTRWDTLDLLRIDETIDFLCGSHFLCCSDLINKLRSET